VEPKEYLEMDEAAKLEEVAPCLRDKLMFRTCRMLGCRISEVLNIAIEDINFKKHEVTILHEKARIKLSCPHCGGRLGKKSKFCAGCGSKVEKAEQREQERRRLRTLPVDQGTLDMMKDFIKRGGPVEKNGRSYLFPITRERAWQIFRECSQKAGLPEIINQETGKVHHVSAHRLRDAFAINAAKKNFTGDGIRLLQEHLGHEDISTTMKYRKIAGEERKEWYEGLFPEDK
jgi:integrase/recombinase XerD